MRGIQNYATLTLVDGRKAAIMRRRSDGFEILPLGGAVFRPGERLNMSGTINGKDETATFVVGGPCGKGGRCRRIRIESVS